MKVSMVNVNNYKKSFDIVCGQKRFSYPFSKLSLKPSLKNSITEVFPDSEVGNKGFCYQLESGEEDTILMDQVLEYWNDPDYVRNWTLYKLTLEAQKLIAKKKIAKREISRRLSTSPAQLYRLLDQRNTKKTIDQMVRLLAALDQVPVLKLEDRKKVSLEIV